MGIYSLCFTMVFLLSSNLVIPGDGGGELGDGGADAALRLRHEAREAARLQLRAVPRGELQPGVRLGELLPQQHGRVLPDLHLLARAASCGYNTT